MNKFNSFPIFKTLLTLGIMGVGTFIYSETRLTPFEKEQKAKQVQIEKDQIAKQIQIKRLEYEQKKAKIALDAKNKAQKDLETIYLDSLVIAQYSLPFVEIKTKKTSYDFSFETHLKNSFKAQKIKFPVSEKYFSSVEIGQTLDTKYNKLKFFNDGDLEKYVVSISDKGRTIDHYIRTKTDWKKITPELYKKLAVLNNNLHEYDISENTPNILVREDASDEIKSEAFGTCYITIKSKKSTLTFDLYTHFENSCNTLNYPLGVPKFLAKDLNAGTTLDSHFVGSSFILSGEISSIDYTVLDKTCE